MNDSLIVKDLNNQVTLAQVLLQHNLFGDSAEVICFAKVSGGYKEIRHAGFSTLVDAERFAYLSNVALVIDKVRDWINQLAHLVKYGYLTGKPRDAAQTCMKVVAVHLPTLCDFGVNESYASHDDVYGSVMAIAYAISATAPHPKSIRMEMYNRLVRLLQQFLAHYKTEDQ